MNHTILPGSLTASYTDTQYTTNGLLPKVGDTFHDQALGKKYIFLKNLGASSIGAQLGAISQTTDRAAFGCRLASATVATNELLFAGSRAVGATTVAQNEYGWFQIGGSATMSAGSDTTTADLGVTFSDQTAGKLEAATNDAAGVRGTFGVAATTTASGDVVVHITRNIWGL